jgi:hypothetical protein
MVWTADLLSLDGTTALNTSTPFKSGRATWSAGDGTGAVEFNLRASDVADGRWLFGQRRIRIKDGGGTARYQGWLDRLERSGHPGAVEYRAASRGLAAALEEGVVHGDFSKVSVIDTTIAWDLIAHVQAQADNVWNFTDGTTTGVGPARTRDYCDGDIIAERIRELAGMEQGFDWEIDADGAFNRWAGGRGTDLTGSITLAPSDAQDWNCVGDSSELRSYMTGLGDRDDNTPCGPPLVIDNDAAAAATYGRREGVLADVSDDEFEMEEKTADALRARIASRVNLKATWIEGRGPWSFGTVWIGDTVTGALGAEFGGNAAIRLISLSVSFDDKYEFIETEWEAA